LIDAVGLTHAPAGADARTVCLVPSITELLYELGLGDRIIGRTGFCIHPEGKVKLVPKVGGTKDVNIGKIRRLAPTHLIVNVDENEKPTVEELARFVPNIVVTHPLGPLDNPGLYRLIGGIFGRREEAEVSIGPWRWQIRPPADTGGYGRQRFQENSSAAPQSFRRGFFTLQIHHHPAAHRSPHDVGQAGLP